MRESLHGIFSWLMLVSWYLYVYFKNIAAIAIDIPIVGSYIANWFISIRDVFFFKDEDRDSGSAEWTFVDLFYRLYYWLLDILDSVEKILDWDSIKSQIITWLPKLETAIGWFTDWAKHITDTIGDWWESTKTTVQGWIDSATEGLADLIAAWDYFWTELFPNLLDIEGLTIWWYSALKQVSNLIESAFTLRSDFWEGWNTARTDVLDFITAPLDWLWERFTDWFLGRE